MSEAQSASEVSLQVNDVPVKEPVNEFAFKDTILARFLPAFVTVMVWIYVASFDHPGVLRSAVDVNGTVSFELSTALGSLWDNFFADNYVMSIAMIFGSLIAGSTPLGGGVVAFPIAVLVLQLNPSQGRDFTVLIQSVGMNAAAFLLLLRKSHLLDFTLVSMFVVMGAPGVLAGLTIPMTTFYVMVTFQILVVEFAFIFLYLNVFSPISRKAEPPVPLAAATVENTADEDDAGSESGLGRTTSPGLARPGVQPVMKVPTGMGTASTTVAADGKPLPVEVLDVNASRDKTRLALTYSLMAIFAFLGGFLTAKVGSGSDIMLFAYGHFVWNVFMPERSFRDNQLTASSVITMGLLSLVAALCRACTRQISQRTFEVWGATSWIVCFGAPLGSLLLTPALQSYLRIAFYVLAVGQFLGFAILKIGPNPNPEMRATAWILFSVLTAALLTSIVIHYQTVARRMRHRGVTLQGMSYKTFLARLLPNNFAMP